MDSSSLSSANVIFSNYSCVGEQYPSIVIGYYDSVCVHHVEHDLQAVQVHGGVNCRYFSVICVDYGGGELPHFPVK